VPLRLNGPGKTGQVTNGARGASPLCGFGSGPCGGKDDAFHIAVTGRNRRAHDRFAIARHNGLRKFWPFPSAYVNISMGLPADHCYRVRSP